MNSNAQSSVFVHLYEGFFLRGHIHMFEIVKNTPSFIFEEHPWNKRFQLEIMDI